MKWRAKYFLLVMTFIILFGKTSTTKNFDSEGTFFIDMR